MLSPSGKAFHKGLSEWRDGAFGAVGVRSSEIVWVRLSMAIFSCVLN